MFVFRSAGFATLLMSVTVFIEAAGLPLPEVTALRTRVVDNGGVSDSFVDLTGTYTLDFLVDFTGRIAPIEMMIELTEGEIIYHPGGGRSPPPPGLIDLAPALRFDTFMTYGFETTAGLPGIISVAGDPLSLPGVGFFPQTFEPQILAAVAFRTRDVGAVSIDRDDFLISRVTLSDDARGTFRFFIGVTERPGEPNFFGDFIYIGQIAPIPEPTCAVLALLVAGVVASRRRGN